MGGFQLPPGWSVVSGGTPPPPSPSPAGFTLPPGWSVVDTAPGLAPPPADNPLGTGSLSERWAASAPRRDAALGGIGKSVLSTLVGAYDLLGEPVTTALTRPGEAMARLLDAISPQQRGLTDLMLNRPAQPRVAPPIPARELLAADPSNPSAPTITPTEGEQPYYAAANIAQLLAPTATGKTALASAALSGGQTGLLSLLQGASPQEAATAAVTAGVLPPVINKAAGGLERAAVTQYQRALGATKEGTKAAAARIAPELVERGVTGSIPALAERGAAESNVVGGQIRAAYDAATSRGVTVSTAPAMQGLARLKSRYVTTGSGGAQVATNPEAVARIEKIEDILSQIGPQATPSQLWQVRQSLDEIVGSAFDVPQAKSTAKEIAKVARQGLQSELDKADPAIRSLNREYGLWRDLENVASATERRRTSQELPLASMLFGVAGAGAQFAHGGDPMDALKAGVLSGLVARGMKSPGFRTRAAVATDRLAGAATAGSDPIARLLAALLGGAAGTPGPNQ